jgi:hypothetical protein
MNDLSSDVGLLKRQFRDVHSVVSRLDRHGFRPNRPSPQQLFARMAARYVLGRQKTRAAAAVSLKDKAELERAREIMESVEAQCFISNSIRSKVSLAAEFVAAPSAK